MKILLDTKDIKNHISDYNTISRNLSGFRKIKTSENHWDGFIITSVELIRKTLIGNKKTKKMNTKNKYTQTHTTKNTPTHKIMDISPNKTIDIYDINTPSTISDLEFDDFNISPQFLSQTKFSP
ncbi:MAG: hypothetical protein EOP45_01915 [Sphingobacteriaceae bacterium]|nr:MAG: hypothetical protein EOP45_01915 [Sphingobacteriaceae bacterium]